jgi:rhamnose transport system permease protein
LTKREKLLSKKQEWFGEFRYWHELVLGALLTGLLIAASLADPAFLSISVQMELSTHIWELALLALPMTLIIVSGGIDLSVGAMMALSAVILGLSYEAGLSPWIGALLAMLTGVVAGAINGAFVAWVRVHPLIVTLATLAAYRGMAEGISLARPISGFPESFAVVGRGNIAGLPIPGAIFAAAALWAALVLGRTSFGRSLYAIGSNEAAARFSGVPVARLKMWIYTVSGAAAGLAAVLFVARRNTAKADIGAGMELDVITAVVLGGTSIYGGRGRILGTLLGVLLIHETREFVSWRWEKDELNLIVIGVLLIVSVLLNSIFSRRQSDVG